MTDTVKVQPANTEEQADKNVVRDGVITGDRSGNTQTSEKELPLGKLGDNPNTGRGN